MNIGKVLIFGDSYSTFRGWIPDGFGYSYSEDRQDGNEVIDVRDTWWHRVITEGGGKLVMNNAWSGSTIGYTGYNGADLSTSKSFIYRFNRLIEDGFFEKNKIDTFFILGGTNDSWSHAPIGELKFDNFKNEDFYSVLPAICYFFKTAKETLPDSDIYCLVNTYLDEKITDGMKKAAEHYGIPTIEFPVIDKWHGHPTILGMKQIADGVIDFLNK
jgi:hypothetical protein